MGRPEAALELLRPALGSFPDNYVLHDVAATVYAKLARYEEAIPLARRAVALKPDDARAHMRLADILGAANRPLEAREPALIAVRLDPENSSVLTTAAETLRRCGDLAEAMALAQRANQLNPDRHRALLGRILLMYESWEEAEVELRHASVSYPDAWDPHFYLALSLLPQGRTGEAKELLERLLAGHPDAKVVPLLWERIEQWMHTEGSLRQRIAATAKSDDLRMELVSLLISQDRLAEATETLTVILDDDPHNARARVQLERLAKRMQARERGEEAELPAMATLERELREESQRPRALEPHKQGEAR